MPGCGEQSAHGQPGVTGAHDDGVYVGHDAFSILKGVQGRPALMVRPALQRVARGQPVTTSMTTGVGLVSAS